MRKEGYLTICRQCGTIHPVDESCPECEPRPRCRGCGIQYSGPPEEFPGWCPACHPATSARYRAEVEELDRRAMERERAEREIRMLAAEDDARQLAGLPGIRVDWDWLLRRKKCE